MSVRRDFSDIPPIWAFGVLVAQGLLARWLPLVTWEGGRLAGMALLGAGLALVLWASLWFRRKRTSIEPRERPSALIVEGPFRVNRNPIYTGMALALLGAGIGLGALSAVLAALVFPVVIDRRFVRGEEAALRDVFGAEAERYIAATRRW
ncbi:methyltransferase family protein [Wenxinia marina]|uniref:Phospholipid methyltransferase n=1 Tax=Wenxinia marina DSM 24838 TaxID=1123501 RepID=A0A0D0NJQ3_9RHOB|nr:methyltransferase [Wenxinia marina]KIQ68560.1 Putative protein-S-isoprenylcysteine methyltransferase [Wenxinia marina DSM 24838]GGL66881.1 hypothetical protein GCM10011392_21740 [Wenxinia marina]